MKDVQYGNSPQRFQSCPSDCEYSRWQSRWMRSEGLTPGPAGGSPRPHHTSCEEGEQEERSSQWVQRVFPDGHAQKHFPTLE